jgi:hypothetical protein
MPLLQSADLYAAAAAVLLQTCVRTSMIKTFAYY